ncbi:MAG: hypothetical protein WBW61_02470 [Rhodanobacteraceae bacterium]
MNVDLDPAAATARLSIPVLWFLAENDENVPYAKSRAALERVTKNSRVDLTLLAVKNAAIPSWLRPRTEACVIATRIGQSWRAGPRSKA